MSKADYKPTARLVLKFGPRNPAYKEVTWDEFWNEQMARAWDEGRASAVRPDPEGPNAVFINYGDKPNPYRAKEQA